jgi:hypothetical protein
MILSRGVSDEYIFDNSLAEGGKTLLTICSNSFTGIELIGLFETIWSCICLSIAIVLHQRLYKILPTNVFAEKTA